MASFGHCSREYQSVSYRGLLTNGWWMNEYWEKCVNGNLANKKNRNKYLGTRVWKNY